MGGALATGLLKSGRVAAADLTVSDPSSAQLKPFAEAGATTTSNNSAAAKGADVVFIVVKPWLVPTVIKEIRSALRDGQWLVVVAAGITGQQLRQCVDEAYSGSPLMFLAIPNLAISELCSMSFIVPVAANSEATQQLLDLFKSMGVAIITEERLLPAATTLASCGIAYALRYIRAASEGGVELGFRPYDAVRTVVQTVRGAVTLIAANRDHPEKLIDNVTTPGGVTIKGLNEMEHAGFTSAVIRGLKAGLK